VTTGFADSGVSGGLSRETSSVRSVVIKNKDMLMLRIVKIVRRRLRSAFRRMSGRNFIWKAVTLS